MPADLADLASGSPLRRTGPSCHQTIEAKAHCQDHPATPKPRLSDRSAQSSTQPSTSAVIFRACWRNAKEGALVRATHGEACSHLVTFGNHLFQGPLDIREPASHHSNDFEIPSRTLQGLRSSRNMKYRIRRNKLRG